MEPWRKTLVWIFFGCSTDTQVMKAQGLKSWASSCSETVPSVPLSPLHNSPHTLSPLTQLPPPTQPRTPHIPPYVACSHTLLLTGYHHFHSLPALPSACSIFQDILCVTFSFFKDFFFFFFGRFLIIFLLFLKIYVTPQSGTCSRSNFIRCITSCQCHSMVVLLLVSMKPFFIPDSLHFVHQLFFLSTSFSANTTVNTIIHKYIHSVAHVQMIPLTDRTRPHEAAYPLMCDKSFPSVWFASF